MEIIKLIPRDWEEVKKIYSEGIETGNATFQTNAPSWEEWDNSFCSQCRLVAKDKGFVIGWIALSKISGRCVYEGVG